MTSGKDFSLDMEDNDPLPVVVGKAVKVALEKMMPDRVTQCSVMVDAPEALMRITVEIKWTEYDA